MPIYDEKIIIDFLKKYLAKLEKLLDEEYSHVLELGIQTGTPLEFPVKTYIFRGERGFHFGFEPSNTTEFDFVDSAPKTKKGFFIHYARFDSIKNKAEALATADLVYLERLPAMIEAHEEEEQARWEYEYHKEVEYELDHYLSYLNKTREIVETTKNEHFYELHQLYQVLVNFNSRLDWYFDANESANAQVFFMVISDLESSIFSTIHGDYFSAMSSLRKILEVQTRATFFSEIVKNDETQRTELNAWLEGNSFSKKYDFIVKELLNRNQNEKISEILIELGLLEGSYLRTKLTKLYSDLSVYVHLRPKENLLDYSLFFTDYEKEKFEVFYSMLSDVILYTDILFLVNNPITISKISHSEYPFLSYSIFEQFKQKLTDEFT